TPCCVPIITPPAPASPLFPYTTLFRSSQIRTGRLPVLLISQLPTPNSQLPTHASIRLPLTPEAHPLYSPPITPGGEPTFLAMARSEEHTSELQSRENLVCRLLLEKKKH